MKIQICRFLIFAIFSLLLIVSYTTAQTIGDSTAEKTVNSREPAKDSNVESEILALDADIKAKQKRILELKLQKLKKQQEEAQNELKKLENSESEENNSLGADKIVKEDSVPMNIIPKLATPKAAKPRVPLTDEASDAKCNQSIFNSQNTFDRKLCVIARAFTTTANPNINDNVDELAVLFMHMAQIDENIKGFITQFENTRTDKQVGSDSTAKGTTSLAVKGTAPKFIGWAIENGAASSDVSGNNVTIRVNPIGLLDALANSSNNSLFGNILASALINKNSPDIKTNFDVEDRDDAFTKIAKKVSIGLTFDITRGTDPPTFIGSKQQISAVSARYEFINNRNPLRKEFNNDWNSFFRSQAGVLDTQLNSVTSLIETKTIGGVPTDVFKNAELQKWVDDTQIALMNIAPNAAGVRDFTLVREKIEERLKQLPVAEVLKDEAAKEALTNLAKSGVKFSAASKEFLDKLNKGTLVTFEYTNNRNANMPDTSNFNFIAEFGKKLGNDGIVDITFNGSLTMFNKKPLAADIKRIKDFNFALQADFPFLSNNLPIGSTLSFSGKYTRMQSDALVAENITALNTKGDIAVGQVKLTIPVTDWGIRFPISFTFANRTELIKESTVRANFGISFDLDTFFGKKKIF